MKTLLLMRHAKSSWNATYLNDYERPLKRRGKIDAAQIAKILETQNLFPDLILSSTAKRAVQTVEILIKTINYENEVIYVDNLYLGDLNDFIDALTLVTPGVESVMIVAHNPGLESYLQELTGDFESMPTASLALLELQVNTWEEVNLGTVGVLKGFWTPKTVA